MIKQEGRQKGSPVGMWHECVDPRPARRWILEDSIPNLCREEVHQVNEKDPDIDEVDRVQSIIGRAKPA